MKVSQLMQKDVVTVGPDASLKDVAAALVAHRISGVPVCDQEGRVLGVVSEGDILYKERGRIERPGGPLAWLVDGTRYAEVTKSWARTAGEAMTAPAITIAPGSAVAEAARLMIEKRVNRLVVVDREGRLVGIIIRADLVRAFTRSDVEIAEEIRDDVLRRVLWVEPETIRITVRNGEVELDGELETRADAAVLVTSSSDPWVPTSSPSATGRPGCGCSSSPSSLSAGRPPSFHDQPNQEEDLMTTAEDTSTAVGPRAVFSRVLVGIDGSHESREAARQAAALAEGELTLLAVYDTALALLATTGTTPPPYLDEDLQRETAEVALRRVRAELGNRPTTGKIAKGCSWEELIREIEREQDTLVVVGSHGKGRGRGIVMGSTATELIHKAPCSVLVTRDAGKEFPRSIVVGVDGSPQSAAAYAAARHLAERFDAKLWSVVADGGKGVDKRSTAMIVGERHEDLPDGPVTALVAAAVDADLLVVGSRGLHGLKSLGSVSERVAHQARSSVLIVREPDWQRISEELEQ